MKKLILLLVALLPSAHAESPNLPGPGTRKAILHALAREMIRVDGEGLIVRKGRPSTFEDLTLGLEQEAFSANTWADFARSLKRLDQAYPNLHAYFEPSEIFPMPSRIIPSVGFSGEWIRLDKTQFRVSRVDPIPFPEETAPKIGDILLGINGKPIEEWAANHFDFCKFTLRPQCDLDFPSDFYNEVVGWTRNEPLIYKIQRGNRVWTISIPLKDRVPRVKDEAKLLCANFPDRYSDFHLAYGGKFACFYEKDNDSSTLILRITSFQYHRSTNSNGPRSTQEEVNAFLPYWQAHAQAIKHLIVDVSDNGGGNQITPYYDVFFDRPYQEQWTRFKKIQELNDATLRAAMFWETNSLELWFQNLTKEGVWDAIPYGEFLPSVPMFCALENEDCRNGLFPVHNPGFKGKVSLIVNQFCVSSCDGFVYTFKQELGARVEIIGQPQAADTAYSRLRIGVELDQKAPEGFRLKMLPQYGNVPAEILFSQIASVTRSVTSGGQIVSGKPLSVDAFISNTVERQSLWIQDAIRAAIH